LQKPAQCGSFSRAVRVNGGTTLTPFLLLARLALAGALIVAGVAKSVDHGEFRRALEDFRLPPRTRGSIAVSLPPIEVIIGFGLLFRASAGPSAITALAIISVFTILIALTLGSRSAPEL
jgi:uncharacterized membrane protein YphA (DoxX/SURF4 family)